MYSHTHINNNNAILRRCFPNTYILIGFHSKMSERDELWIDPMLGKVRASFMVIGALAAAMVAETVGGSADLWL